MTRKQLHDTTMGLPLTVNGITEIHILYTEPVTDELTYVRCLACPWAILETNGCDQQNND